MKSFYNTNAETGDQLRQSCIRATSLQDQIFAFFRAAPGRHYTPAEVARYFPKYPLTSVRRAMTNLTDAELLTKTKLRTPGIYGSPNFNWRLNADYKMEQRRLFV